MNTEELRESIISDRSDEYEDELSVLGVEELIDDNRLNEFIEEEIERRVERYREELEAMSDEELGIEAQEVHHD